MSVKYENPSPSQVNGVSVIGMQHSDVVAAIKAGGDETKLLVVDSETDEFFRRCSVLPTEEHVNGMTHMSTVMKKLEIVELRVYQYCQNKMAVRMFKRLCIFFPL